MSGAISSSIEKASEKVSKLKVARDSFSGLSVSAQSSISSTSPAQKHDENADGLKASLETYCSSLERDANAIVGIAENFDEQDKQLAAKLLN